MGESVGEGNMTEGRGLLGLIKMGEGARGQRSRGQGGETSGHLIVIALDCGM